MSEHREPRPSEILREQLADVDELYNEAKLDENSPQMERLGKIRAQYLNQIKAHEVHERESMKRKEIRRKAQRLGILIGVEIKKYVADPEHAVMLIEHICEKMIDLINEEDEE